MNGALLTRGYHLAGPTGLQMGALTPTDEMDRFHPEAVKVVARLFGAMVSADALRPTFVSLLAFKIQQLAWQRKPPGSHDVIYWRERGSLAPDCTFGTPAPVGSKSRWRGWSAR